MQNQNVNELTKKKQKKNKTKQNMYMRLLWLYTQYRNKDKYPFYDVRFRTLHPSCRDKSNMGLIILQGASYERACNINNVYEPHASCKTVKQE